MKLYNILGGNGEHVVYEIPDIVHSKHLDTHGHLKSNHLNYNPCEECEIKFKKICNNSTKVWFFVLFCFILILIICSLINSNSKCNKKFEDEKNNINN
jgi:hypothetical protein